MYAVLPVEVNYAIGVQFVLVAITCPWMVRFLLFQALSTLTHFLETPLTKNQSVNSATTTPTAGFVKARPILGGSGICPNLARFASL